MEPPVLLCSLVWLPFWPLLSTVSVPGFSSNTVCLYCDQPFPPWSPSSVVCLLCLSFRPRLFVRLRLWSRPSLSSCGPVVALKGSPSKETPAPHLDYGVLIFCLSSRASPPPLTSQYGTGRHWRTLFFFAADLEIDGRQTARAGLSTSRALAVSPCTISFLSVIIIQVIFATVLRFSAMCNLRSQSWPQVQ